MTDIETLEGLCADILVVDDVPENLKLLMAILADRGYRVRPASSGRLALKSVAAKLPDLILLDIKMPKMDGYELCRLLKSEEKSRDVPVIFVSALHETINKVKGFEAGGVDFITKPFQMEEVLARVETHLALRRLQERLQRQNTQLQLEIAERRKAEDALRRSENLHRTISENTGTALVIVEEDALISYANTRFVTLSGYSREELEGTKRWTDFVAHEDLEKMKRNHVLRRIEPSAVPDHYEFLFVDREGTTRHVVVNVAMIPGTARSVASLMDVSHLKKMEADLERARYWESIGIFAGGIAHDFNNLLGIILGNLNLAEMELGGPEPKSRKHLKEAEQACVQSSDLTQRLIALTGGGGLVGRSQPVRGLIAEAVNDALKGSTVRHTVDLAEDLWPVECDPLQIKETLSKLAVNAEEASTEGGVIEVSARNELLATGVILALKAGKYVHILIRDYGKGIPEELLTRVFDPYFSTKERGARKGMGLGLTSAYATVKRHRGDIGLESKVGVGTTVHLYLPASEESSRP